MSSKQNKDPLITNLTHLLFYRNFDKCYFFNALLIYSFTFKFQIFYDCILLNTFYLKPNTKSDKIDLFKNVCDQN
jgi:hypothetical protein